MSGFAFHCPSHLNEFPSGCEAGGGRLGLPEVEIEVAVGLIQWN
jgi:hypothetical protein